MSSNVVTASLPASATIDAIKSSGALRVGVALNIPWLGQDPTTNEYYGPSTVIAKALADELGVKLQYVPVDFGVTVAALQAHQIDISVAPLSATPARLKIVDMAPWTAAGTCYLVQKSGPKVTSEDQLNDPSVRITGLQGNGNLALVQAKYPKATYVVVVGTAGQVVDFLDVISGKADVAIVDSPIAALYAAKYPQLTVMPTDCATNADLPSPINVAYNKDDPGFAQFVQATLATIKPQLDASLAKYSGPDYLKLP